VWQKQASTRALHTHLILSPAIAAACAGVQEPPTTGMLALFSAWCRRARWPSTMPEVDTADRRAPADCTLLLLLLLLLLG